MLESWPFVTWPWHDLYLPPSHGHPQYRPVTIQRCYKLKRHIYKALFGLSRRHSQKQQDLAFDLSLTWPVTSIFKKNYTLWRVHHQGYPMPFAACRYVAWFSRYLGGQNAPPTGARWSPEPNGARVNLCSFMLKSVVTCTKCYRDIYPRVVFILS